MWGFFVFIVVFIIYHAYFIIASLPIDYRIADMLPVMKVMCQRLFHGEIIYKPIPEIWNGLLPVYLPLMWLPIAPFEYIGIDVRWTTIIFFLLGIFFLLMILFPFKKNNALFIMMSLTSLFFLINYIVQKEKRVLSITEEGIIIGYYLFLGYALSTKKTILQAIAISLCLLSRFSLLLWIPVYIFYTYYFESKQKGKILVLIISIIVLLVFLIPFGFRQMDYFLTVVPYSYRKTYDIIWATRSVEIMNYLGFAKFFDISQQKLLANIQIVTSVLSPVLFFSLFKIFYKKLSLNNSFLGICSLKFSLVFFYNFLEIPFYYVFLVPTFFSYCILFNYLNEKELI